jgi:transposase InsO family protein
MDDKERREIALWRIGVLGPLVSARVEHGDIREHVADIVKREHRKPEGQFVELGASTIERWYYEYKREGFEALHPTSRSDCGKSKVITGRVADLILRAKQDKPRRSIKIIIRMLERAKVVKPGELTRSTVHRFLQSAGISNRPLRAARERRSFIAENAGDLWIGDALHGPRVIGIDGKLHKSYLLSQIDNATRFTPHSYFTDSEDAAAQEYGFKESILKYGVPRVYYVDRGAAYISTSLRVICADLGIRLLHTGAGDCEAKGAIERWHRTLREEVLDELSEEPITLGELNSKYWAWLGVEYHERIHETTQRVPRRHFLEEVGEIRQLPRNHKLDEVFLHREERTVRKDGTVQFEGNLLEVRSELCGQKVELRFDPHDKTKLPQVFVNGRFYCDTVLLDRIANMYRKRRPIPNPPVSKHEPLGMDPLGLMEDEFYRHTHRVSAEVTNNDDNNNDDEE